MTLPRHPYKPSNITPGRCGAGEHLTPGHIRCCGLPESHLAHDVFPVEAPQLRGCREIASEENERDAA